MKNTSSSKNKSGFKTITVFINNRKHVIDVKLCKSILSKFRGLMFKKNSPPLLFAFSKEKTLSIHSFFCKPFTAIWLDQNFHATKIAKIKTSRFNISGRGKYLLEIPTTNKKIEFTDGS